MYSFVLTFLLLALEYQAAITQVINHPAIHLPIHRRGGRFVRRELVNLTELHNSVSQIQRKYDQTVRRLGGNRWVRQWNDEHDKNVPDDVLFTTAGLPGQWYTTIQIGTPAQSIEFDLDMLSPDFYCVQTTSGRGTKFDTFSTTSYVESGKHIHPFCGYPSDRSALTTIGDSFHLNFALCSPPKASRWTLTNSGGVLGLSLPGPLSRIAAPPLLENLLEKRIVTENLWSMTLLDSETGILSLGGTLARDIEAVKIRGGLELENYGNPNATPEWITRETRLALDFTMPSEAPTSSHFKWIDVQKGAGWWTALMSGVWVDGAKVFKNQPVLFDIQCPYILAPPGITEHFYNSIAGTKQMAAPHENFFVYPCANAPILAFELGGWNFPVMNGNGIPSDALYGPPGGRFSLGKLGEGNGYCVGSMVAKDMTHEKKRARTGLHNTWVLGEPFFRGMGVAFDVEKSRIGFRTF